MVINYSTIIIGGTMKNQKTFIISVIAAIALPVVFGCIYYNGLTSKKYETNISSSIKSEPDLIIENNKLTKINTSPIVDKDYLNSNYIDFAVTYINGNYSYRSFLVYLDNISYSDNINPRNLKWKLMEFNNDTEEYEQLFNGTFEDMVDNSLKIGSDINIGLNNFQKYRLYYYISYDMTTTTNYSDSTFSAELNIRKDV